MAGYVYDERIAARYDAAVPLQPGEVDFYLALARDAAARRLRTLEVTCGTGRIAIPHAREGIRVVGLDNSAAMLAVARQRATGLDTIAWVEGDMRSFLLGEEFGLVYIPAGSFQLMLTIDDQLDTLRTIHRHLAPGGRLAFEVESPNIVAMAEWLTSNRGVYRRRTQRDYRHPQSGLQVRSWQSLEYHPTEQQYISHGMLDELDDELIVVRREHGRPMTVRYFYRYEMEHLLARAGFEVEAMYGDFYKNVYKATSADMIWVARRP